MTSGSNDLAFRRPTEADHARIIDLVDDWWGGRRVHGLLPRLWFQHFNGTSWFVDAPHGRPAGFLVGFVSPDEPTLGVVHMAAVSPNHRRRGIGSELHRRFFDDVRARGVRRVRAVGWPDDRIAVLFHRALGFEPVGGPGSRSRYGTTAHLDYDYPGEDRVVFERRLDR